MNWEQRIANYEKETGFPSQYLCIVLHTAGGITFLIGAYISLLETFI